MASSAFALVSLHPRLAHQPREATTTGLGISLPLMLFKRQELGAHPMQESSIVTVHLIRVDFSADCRHASNLWMGCGHLAPQNNSCIALISKFPSIISGFWMGPDAEDGWGFVEAFVDHGF